MTPCDICCIVPIMFLVAPTGREEQMRHRKFNTNPTGDAGELLRIALKADYHGCTRRRRRSLRRLFRGVR